MAFGFAISGLALGAVVFSLLFVGLEAGDSVSNVVSAVVSSIGLVVALLAWLSGPDLPKREPRSGPGILSRRPGSWLSVLEVVLLPVIGIAVLRRPGTGIHDLFGVLAILAPLVVLWPGLDLGWPRRGPEYLFRCIALPVLLVSATAVAWSALPLPGAAADTCGVARIEVDQDLLPAVQMLFSANRSRIENGRSCAEAVEFSALDGDPHAALRTPQTPIAGVITADPATVQGLGGGWGDLTVEVASPADWILVGQVPAVVYLDQEEYQTRSSVALSELTSLGIRDVTPPDPVAIALQHASPRPEIQPRTVDLNDSRSCLGVVLAAGLDSACRAEGIHDLTLEDADGNTIGAEVLGIPLTAEGQRTSADAAHSFLDWLDRSEARTAIGLVASTAQPGDVLERSAVIAPVARPLHVSILLDSSQSMGLAARGATVPYAAAREAVLRWALARPLDEADRLTVIPARTGVGSLSELAVTVAGDATSGLDVPDPGTGSATGLGEAFKALGPPEDDARPVLVLLTDGVNALDEEPLPAAVRENLKVVVIGGSCGRQPAWAKPNCRSTDAHSGHIADQLTALAKEP